MACGAAVCGLAADGGARIANARPQDQNVIPEDYKQYVAKIAAKQGPRERYRTIKELDQIGRKEMQSKGIYPKLTRGNPDVKTVALTFDDGPYEGDTLKLLDVLKKAGVRATMFNVAYKCEAHPELLKAEIDAGMEIANHTYMHLSLPGLPERVVENELVFGAKRLQELGHLPHEVDICRPRGGEYDGSVVNAAHRHEYTMVLWTDDPGDYKGLPAKEIERILVKELNPGGIVLLHDSLPETRLALPGFIAYAKRKKYKFITCSEMLKEKGVITWGGPNEYHPGR